MGNSFDFKNQSAIMDILDALDHSLERDRERLNNESMNSPQSPAVSSSMIKSEPLTASQSPIKVKLEPLTPPKTPIKVKLEPLTPPQSLIKVKLEQLTPHQSPMKVKLEPLSPPQSPVSILIEMETPPQSPVKVSPSQLTQFVYNKHRDSFKFAHENAKRKYSQAFDTLSEHLDTELKRSIKYYKLWNYEKSRRQIIEAKLRSCVKK